ncbi:MAG: hypothetical protein K6C94_09605 [Candidatus Gastranaerophilales bacterium]|nr:hypothetical protein [Candidatus Gastranaerophilales bacterium]
MKNKIFLGLVSLLIFVFFGWFLSNDIFSGDDIAVISAWLQEGGKFNFDGIITAFISHVYSKDIPLLFHINPHEFSMTAGAWIRAFDVTVLCLMMSFFFFNGRKITGKISLIALFSAFYFSYACANIEFKCFNPNLIPNNNLDGSFVLLTEYSQHFGQLFNLIIGLCFLYFLIFHFTQNKIPDKKHLFLICIFSFLTAMSSLFVNVVCGFALTAAVLYLFIINIKSLKNENTKILLFPFLSYIAGSIAFAVYPGYLNFFKTDFNFLKISKTIFKNFVMLNSMEIALIVILSAILFFLAAKKTTYIKRTLFVVYASLAGAYTYFYLFSSLNFLIPTFLTESQVLLRILLMSFVFLLFGSCIKEHQSEPKELKVISACFSLLLAAFFVVQAPLVWASMSIWRNVSQETKNVTYCIEKMYRFYSLRNKTALLPDDSLLKIFKIRNFVDDKNVDIDEMITNRTFFKHTTFTEEYYKTFYKNPNIVAYKFIDSKTALKIFFEEGGMIDAKELGHINFQNLYNDEFVLNRAYKKDKFNS